MNQLNAVIKSVETGDEISLVIVEAAGIAFTALVTNTTAVADFLYKGNEVIVMFKETAMSLSKNLSGSLSIRNRFPSVVTAIKSGKILTTVTLNFKEHKLTSVITTHAANELAITVNDIVDGLVKTSDISLMQQ